MSEEEKPKRKKRRWEKGIDMKEFSGSSWKELHDVWPADVRVASEAWKILSVFQPAMMNTQKFIASLCGGVHFKPQDFYILCWIQRCEEAKSNVATESWSPKKGMNIGRTLWSARTAKLIKHGIIEDIPSPFRLYRVTKIGKLIIKNFIDNVEQAHQDIKYWVNSQPAENAEKVNRYLSQYCFEWEKLKEMEDNTTNNAG